MSNPLLKSMPPMYKLIIFFGLMVLMYTLAAGVVGVFNYLAYGVDLQSLPLFLHEINNPEALQSLQVSNGIYQIIAFLGSVLLFLWMFGKSSVNTLWLKEINWTIVLIPLLVMAASPIIELSILLNDWMIPAGGALEAFFKPMEEEAARITEALLAHNQGVNLYINILVMALIPAICEEFVFRGVFQSLLSKAFGNIHLGVWVAAALFSAIHLQFYGFIPRMLLGAIFGYLIVWTGSIWPSVIAHFTNNLSALLISSYYNQNPELDQGSIEQLSLEPLPFILSISSFVLLLYILYRKTKWPVIRQDYLLSQP